MPDAASGDHAKVFVLHQVVMGRWSVETRLALFAWWQCLNGGRLAFRYWSVREFDCE